MILFRGRDNDRKKHAIHGDAHRVRCRRRQDVADDYAEHRSGAPAGYRNKRNAVRIERMEISVHRNGQAEDFIGDAVRETEAVHRLHRRIELLCQRAAHQKVPQVDDKRCRYHFNETGAGTDQTDRRELTGGSNHGKRHDEGLQGVHTGVSRGNAKRERNGIISHTDRNAREHSFQEPAAGRFVFRRSGCRHFA